MAPTTIVLIRRVTALRRRRHRAPVRRRGSVRESHYLPLEGTMDDLDTMTTELYVRRDIVSGDSEGSHGPELEHGWDAISGNDRNRVDDAYSTLPCLENTHRIAFCRICRLISGEGKTATTSSPCGATPAPEWLMMGNILR